jgi:hypothetical protein
MEQHQQQQPFSPNKLMLWMLSMVPNNILIFGPIDNVNPIMPRHNDDGRKLTWEKLINDYCDKITNNPQSQAWCWFVRANHSAGGTGTTKCCCKHKISITGTGNW